MTLATFSYIDFYNLSFQGILDSESIFWDPSNLENVSSALFKIAYKPFEIWFNKPFAGFIYFLYTILTMADSYKLVHSNDVGPPSPKKLAEMKF